MVISMLKIRRPLERLIFNMGIAIPGKTVFLIETAPWFHTVISSKSTQETCYNLSVGVKFGSKSRKKNLFIFSLYWIANFLLNAYVIEMLEMI